jgi:hypothetical protein
MTLLVAAVILLSQLNMAQTKEADPKDVGSMDSIIKAVYDVISGEAGKPRNRDRFRTLFHADARLIPTGKNQETGITTARILTPEDYIKRVEPVFVRDGFFESEKARQVHVYGNIAHVFSTYEARRTAKDRKPFMRGINSFQLLNDGKRWWVLSIYWQAETPDNPIPARYLNSGR